MRSPRLWVVLMLMCFTALVLHVRGDVDHVPYSRPLSELPMSDRLAHGDRRSAG